MKTVFQGLIDWSLIPCRAKSNDRPFKAITQYGDLLLDSRLLLRPNILFKCYL